MAKGLERIPLLISSDYTRQPVRAVFPDRVEAPSRPEILWFQPNETAQEPESKDSDRSGGVLKDSWLDLKSGVEQIPGAVTGLLDIPVGAIFGVSKPISRGWEKIGERTGFQPGKWAKENEASLSPERAAQMDAVSRAWERAGGNELSQVIFDPERWSELPDAWDKADAAAILKAYKENPRASLGVVMQSLPSTAAGGAGGFLAKKLAKVSGTVAAGIGEGALTAGQTMDQIDASADPRTAALASTIAGAITGKIGVASGKVATKLGIPDIEVAMSGGKPTAAMIPGVAARVPAAIAKESLLEEVPQSMQEQAWQNFAEGKPIGDRVLRQGVEGGIAGGLTGGAFALKGPIKSTTNTFPEEADGETGKGSGPAPLSGDYLPADQSQAVPKQSGSQQRAAIGEKAYEGDVLPPIQLPQGRRLLESPAIEGELGADQQSFPRQSLYVPEVQEPTPRQAVTALGLLNHSSRPSPDLLVRQMRIDSDMATMLFNHWEARKNGALAAVEQGNAEVPTQGTEVQSDFIPGSANILEHVPSGDTATGSDRARMDESGNRQALPAGPEGAQDVVTQDIRPTNSLQNTASWVIKNKETGEIVMETFDRKKIAALNTKKYVAVPILEHLQSLNAGQNVDVQGVATPNQPIQEVSVSISGAVTVRGYPVEQVKAAAKEIGVKAVIGNNGSAVFPKGTDIAKVKAALERGVDVQQKKKRKTASANTLLQAIVNRGGINRSIMQDVGGDPGARYMPGLFTKDGTSDLSMLAEYLFNEDGFHQLDMTSDAGPARELEDAISRALRGERIINTSTMERERQAEEIANMKARAKALGIKTAFRSNEQIAADVLKAESKALIDEETRLEEEALVAYNDAVDALNSAIGAEDVETFLEDLAMKYQDATQLQYLRGATADIQEKINEAIRYAGKPQETDSGATGQGDEAGRQAGSTGASLQKERTPSADAFALESQSEQDLAREAQQRAEAEAQRQREEHAAEQKRQADAERGSFSLTGSDRSADVLAAQGQKGLFEAAAPSAQTVTERADRRNDTVKRKRIEHMTPDEMRRELLTDSLTGIGNRRAYEEADKLPVQVSIDADSLKWINDNLGHQAGDQSLKMIADALRAETDQAFHLSGDEYVIQAQTTDEAVRIMEAVQKRLDGSILRAELPNGDTVSLTLGVSYGTGQDLGAAERGLQEHKRAREVAGLRAARGETPQSATRSPRGQGQETPVPGGREEVKYASEMTTADHLRSAAEKMEGKETLPGTRAVAQRQVNAADKFINSVMEQFGLSREEAGLAWDYFIKNKLVKVDSVGGQYELKDGRLWDKDAMRRAADLSPKPESIAGKPVSDMTDDQLRNIARGLSPTYGEAAVDKAKAELRRRDLKEGAPTPDNGELGSRALSNQDAGAASVRADESGRLEEPTQSEGAVSKANATDIPASVQEAALKAARKEQNRLNEYDLQEEIRSIGNNGMLDTSKLASNPEYWDAENEEFTQAGFNEIDRLTEEKARDNLNIRPINELEDLNDAHQFAQVEAMEKILDGLGLGYKRNYSWSTSRYIMVDRGENADPLKLRFADHLNTARGQPSPDINVAPGGDTFMDAVAAVRNLSPKPSESNTSAERVSKTAKREQVEPTVRESLTAGQSAIESHSALFGRIRAGEVTAEQFKAAFESAVKSKDMIEAELSAMTKDKILDRFPGLRYRYKNEKKDRVVRAAYDDMLTDFVLGQGFSYTMGANSYIDGIRAKVDKITDESLDEYAQQYKNAIAEREQARKEAEAGMENPETLDDLKRVMAAKAREIGDGATFKQAYMAMKPEWRAQYDELTAEQTRGERNALDEAKRTTVRAAGQEMEGQIVETKHTRTGEDLFVVKAAERVDREIYNQWNATAKRLGGWYSSYRGAGAVPGFQFKTRENAQAFLKYLGGDTEQAKEAIQQRRDEFADDKSQSSVERLTEMADKLDERADASLSQERKTNTERRARMAGNAEAAANSEKALAKTMRNIADAIENKTAKFLNRIRQKSQVEMLQGMVATAQNEKLRQKYPSYAEQEKHKGEAPNGETASYAEFPSYTAYRSDLASLGRALLETEGTKKLGQRLMKVADDVSAAYLKFAKENLHQVSKFSTRDGQAAIFKTKDEAEEAIHRSGYSGAAIVLPFKRGENLIIFSPSEAIRRGVWEGDNDKRITISPDLGAEIVEKLGKMNRRKDAPAVPWQFESAYDKLKRLSAIGIERPAELRAALREFINLREAPKAPDRVKELERAMVGRKNDGLDFFPTAPDVVDEMLGAADIKEGMSILEPSAGMGHIADKIREAGIEPDVGELSGDRRELLEAKGYRVVAHDFMATTKADTPDGAGYDRIIMNPPFSDRRDAEHVQHAYSLLKPGGRIVAITGEGVFFGKDKKAEAFREWLDSVGGTSEKLAEGSFLDPSLPVNTGVNARMVVIEKGIALEEPASQAYTDAYDNIETRPGTTDRQTDLGRKALADAERRIFGRGNNGLRGVTPTLQGSAISRDFRENGGTDFIGKKITEPRDLAVLAQVVRDPRFETFRVFYVNGNTIVGEAAYSSRLPATVYMPINIAELIEFDKARFKADGYWMLHNHPGGSAVESKADLNITEIVADSAPGFRGHVIIDHNEYNSIARLDGAMSGSLVSAPELEGIDLTNNAEAPNQLLGEAIKSPRALVDIAKRIQVNDGMVTIVATGNAGRVRLVVEVPVKAFDVLGASKRDQLRAIALVRRATRETGAGGHLFAVVPGLISDHPAVLASGIFTDVIDSRMKSAAEVGEVGRGNIPETGRQRAGMRLKEPGSFYRTNTLESRGPTFYSQLARAVEQAPAKIDNGPAAQWKAWLLSNAGKLGVKKDEIQWTGITDWLDAQKGKVSKADIAEYLRTGGVQVEEVMLSDDVEKSARLARDLYRQLTKLEEQRDTAIRILDNDVYAKSYKDDAQHHIDSITPQIIELRARFDEANRTTRENEKAPRTKFSQYTLPGGENYRELLLTLPTKKSLPDGFEARQMANGNWGVFGPGPLPENRYGSGPTEEAAIASFGGHGHNGTVFKSSHFDQPNILAHVRFNERTDAEGRRVLFIEEIQSDWGQKGKKEGFVKGPRSRAEVLKELQEKYAPNAWFTDEARVAAGLAPFSDSEFEEVMIGDGINPPEGGRASVTSAPFVTDTKSWTALALKRMLRYAADNGFDAVAWTTGAQQAERYALSKHLDRLEYWPKSGLVAGYKDGNQIINKPGVKPDDLADVVGKEAAEKLLATDTDKGTRPHELRGGNLSIGGEGMHAYYDQILPQVASDVLKKVGGGKVESVNLGGDPYADIHHDVFSDGTERVEYNGVEREFPNSEEADAYVRSLKEAKPQPAILLTPEMKATIQSGLPLFSRGKANAGNISDIESVRDSFQKEFKGAADLDIRVVQSRDEIPASLRPSPYAEGVYHDGLGLVYLIVDNIPSKERAFQILMHEAVGHYGMAKMMGDRFSGILKHVTKVARAKGKVTNDTYRPGDADYATIEAVRLRYPEASEEEIAQEVLARMAETEPGRTVFGYVRAIVRQWLRDVSRAIGITVDVTTTELKDLVAKASAYMRRGDNLASEYQQSGIVAASEKASTGMESSRSTSPVGVNSPEFKRWFGDSKVVDAEGKPLVVYHGTTADVSAFDLAYSGSDGVGYSIPAIFATTDKPLASDYAINKYNRNIADAMRAMQKYKNEHPGEYGGEYEKHYQAVKAAFKTVENGRENGIGANVIPAYMALKNPLIVDAGGKGFMEVMPGNVAKAHAEGHDGLIVKNVIDHASPASKYPANVYVAFRPEQIKSAIGNRGTFDPGSANILESRAAPQGPIWSAPDMSRADNLIYILQDKNIDLKRVQEGIKKAIGDIRDDIDTYLQEELFHGRAAKATDEFLERELQPFIGEMKQRGIDMDSLETYLWARHAAERNAQIAKINPDMPEGGSGLTDRQAADILAGKNVKIGGKTITGIPPAKARSYADLAKKVDAMVAGNRMLLELYELETPETVAAWKAAYKHYVPLQREDAETPWAGPGTGMGYSVRGSSVKRATGSFRPVENIMANLVLQRTRTITRGEKNRVAQALYGMAKAAPNEEFWTTDDVPMVRVVENKAIYHVMDGETEVANFTSMSDAEKKARENSAWFVYQDRGDRVVERQDPSFRSKPNVVWSRFNGEDRFVIFNERDERAMRMAASLKNLDADDISNALGEVARWTRYFASINTQYNPVFGIVNLIRDTGTSVLNLSSTPLAGKQAELLGNVYQTLPAIYKAVRIDRKGGTPTGTWAQLWEEFQEVGGQTGYRDMFRNSHEQREALEKALDPKWWKDKWWGKALSLGGVLAVPEHFLSEKIGKPVFEWLSDYNTTMENGIRLSAYKLGLDQGMTKERAASLAKNLTVNFNRKGQAARQIGAMYAFFNASVQGTARMAETLHTGAKPGEMLGKAGKQIVYGGMLLGAIQAMLLMAAGFDDDEPPEFVRDRNIIIPIGNKKYLTVAMPLGFHVLPALGRIATEFVIGGFKKPGEHVVHIFDLMADAFNPIGNAGLSMQTLAPTVLDPVAALAENKDWSGKPIYREDFSKLAPTPGFSRTKDTATAFSKALAYALNVASGGTEFKKGLMSPTPDQIDYLIGQVTGGVGRELGKVEQTVRATITGSDLPPYKIPLFGRFYGNASGQSSESGRFYDNLKAMNEHQAELQGLWKSNRSAQAAAYSKEHPEATLFRYADRMQRHVAALRKEKARLEESGAPRDKIKKSDEMITTAMREFNQKVAQTKEPKKSRGLERIN